MNGAKRADYKGSWINVTDACAILGVTSTTFYKNRKRYPDFPARNEYGRYLDLDILAWAAKHSIRTAKIVRG